MARLEKPANQRGKRKPEEAAEDVKTVGGELPKPATVKKLNAELATLSTSMAQVRGQMGSLIKNAETDNNIHRGALREALKQFKMDPQKREEYQRHLGHYVIALGIGYQPDLFNDEDKSPAAEATFGGRKS